METFLASLGSDTPLHHASGIKKILVKYKIQNKNKWTLLPKEKSLTEDIFLNLSVYIG